MPVITEDRVEGSKTVVDSMIDRGKTLFDDITETAQELTRLYKENEQTARDLKTTERDRQRLQSRVEELEAMLDSVRATVEMAKPNGGQKTEPLAFRRRPDTPAGSQGLLPRDDKAIP